MKCGLLHCVHLNEKLMFWRESLSKATPATFLTKGSKQYVCRSAILDVGLNMPDPGQAPDGAKCADKKVDKNMHWLLGRIYYSSKYLFSLSLNVVFVSCSYI